jgi:hypothetical protein
MTSSGAGVTASPKPMSHCTRHWARPSEARSWTRSLTDGFDRHGDDIEHQAVICFDRTQLSDHGLDSAGIRWAKAKEVRVPSRAVAMIQPESEQHGALEHEVITMTRNRKPVQQPLHGIAVQGELELLSVFARVVQ